MKSLLIDCLLAGLIAAPFYLLYWNLFRPVLIQRLKYRIFKCRDDLRLLVISGQFGKDGKAYPLIEKFCNLAICKIENVDLPALMTTRPDTHARLQAERDIATIMESPLPLRNLFFQATTAVAGAACANSPGALILLAPLFVFGVTILWFQKAKKLASDSAIRAFGSFYVMRPA